MFIRVGDGGRRVGPLAAAGRARVSPNELFTGRGTTAADDVGADERRRRRAAPHVHTRRYPCTRTHTRPRAHTAAVLYRHRCAAFRRRRRRSRQANVTPPPSLSSPRDHKLCLRELSYRVSESKYYP